VFAVYPALVFSTLPFSRTSGVMRPFLRIVPATLAFFGVFLFLSHSAESFPVMVYALYLMVFFAFVGLAFPTVSVLRVFRGARS
jgi:hypothetical protein